jgi:predicted RNA-binding protein associated with RNAse of E/G family
MKAEPVPYNSILRCIHLHELGVRYELPAHYVGKLQNYHVYYRPEPIVHHLTKQKNFLLPYPEVILVGDSLTHHCISFGFENKQVKNIYININLPPKVHVNGHEWEDLELDLKITIDSNGWQVSVVDVDEFICAKTLSKRHRRLAWKEISSLIERIKLRQFPFGDDMGKIIDYAQSMGLFPY